MGGLFTDASVHPPLIKDHLIHFMRVHPAAGGGLGMRRKRAALGEFFGLCTAWHGLGDISPVGHATNPALDLAWYSFDVKNSTCSAQRRGRSSRLSQVAVWIPVAQRALGAGRGGDRQPELASRAEEADPLVTWGMSRPLGERERQTDVPGNVERSANDHQPGSSCVK